MEDPAVIVLLALNLALLGVAAALLLAGRPLGALIVALISPCVSGLLKGNSPEAEQAETGIGAYIRVSLMMLAGAAGFLAFMRARTERPARSRLPAQFWLLGAFIGAAVASAAWSVEPVYTLIRAGSFVALGGLLMGVLAWSRRPLGVERVLDACFIFLTVWTLANFATLAVWPARAWWWNAPNRFLGISDHPNSVGGFCMVAYPIFLWKITRSHGLGRLAVAALIPMALAMQVLSGSRSSLISVAVGVVVFLAVSGWWRSALVFTSAAGVAAAILIAHPPESLKREVTDDTTVNLTGRPDIWKASWRLFERRPMAGYGFETQNKLFQDAEFQKLGGVNWTVYTSQSTHNGYLSILLGGGIFAFLVWLAAILVPFARLWGLEHTNSRAVILAIITMCLFTNFVESLITGGSSMPAVVFWICWALGARLIERESAITGPPATIPAQAEEGLAHV